MQMLKFFASTFLTLGAIFILNNSFTTSLAPIPAFGKFLNPHTGFWQNAESSEAILTYSSIESDSLLEDVKIIFDERQIPHIFAENRVDAAFVQGFLAAKNRLWQMDFMIRDASGRLSEVLGESLLERDVYKRKLGLTVAAERTLEVWKADSASFKLVESYVNGVNNFIENLTKKEYPLEFKLLDYEPEKWTALKSVLITKAMAEMLALRAKDIEATNARAFFSEGAYRFLYPEFFPEQLPIIPKEVDFVFAEKNKDDTLSINTPKKVEGYLGDLYLEVGEPNLGSNNWAIARGKTVNWKAILAGDPHLYLTLPSIWYELQIHTPSSNTYGVSIPGLLGIAIGFNEHHAWSMTNTEHDVADFYTIEWRDNTKQAYLLDSQFVNVEKRVEKITTKKGYFEFEKIDTVRWTSWGPIIHESEIKNQKDLALRWLAHDKPACSDANIFVEMNESTTVETFQNAIKNFTVPSQNFAYADNSGTIGMFVQGNFPKKQKGQGKYIQNGTLSSNSWDGNIPLNENPKVVNPVWGFVSSANQHSTTDNYPHYYNSEFFESYRGRVIQDTLTQNIDFSVEDMKTLQLNNFSLKTYELFDLMMSRLDFERMNDAEKAVFQRLLKWDYHYDWYKLEPIYFEEWFNTFYDKTWDELSEQTKFEKILYPSHWRTVYILRDLPESSFFDIKSTPHIREDAKDIITIAFQEMVKNVYLKLLENPDLNWSNYRNTTISHLSQIPAFSHKQVQTSGYQKAINAVTSVTGPSWRMVVEMDEKPKAWVVYPGGQSGNPGSIHYDDFVETWAKGGYFTANFMTGMEEVSQTQLSLDFKTTK